MKKLVTYLFALGTVAAIAVGTACVTGGEEGDHCNPLVHREECDKGLVCTASTCSVFYCCPTAGPTSEPNCQNLAGCPDEDAGTADDAGTNLADADAGAETNGDADAAADAVADADAAGG